MKTISIEKEQPSTRAARSLLGSVPIWLVGALLMVVAHAPLVIYHLASALAKPHYQFILLLPFGMWLLFSQRRSETGTYSPGSPAVSAGVLAGCAAVLTLATFTWSPWLGAFSLILSLLAVAFAAGGEPLVRCWFPPWLMLVFFVGLPFNLDESLIGYLRQVATRWSSELLDELGFRHMVMGNVIQVPGKSFFVADACTGIHSMFVVSAAAMFLGLWNRRSFLQISGLLVCGILIVMVENLTRLSAVVIGYVWGIDLSAGLNHELLGVAVFVASLMLVWSADQFVFCAIPGSIISADSTEHERRKASIRVAGTQAAHSIYMYRVVAFVFCCLALWQLARLPSSPPHVAAAILSSREIIQRWDKNEMPETLEGFRRQGYRFEERDAEDPKGHFSQIWTYGDDRIRFDISLDYPYPTAMDHCLCYRLTGWTVLTASMIVNERQVAESVHPEGFVKATLERPIYGSGFLLFSYFNDKSQSLARVYPVSEQTAWSQVKSRIRALFQPPTTSTANLEIDGPVVQVHLFATGPQLPTEENERRLFRFFHLARQRLEKACAPRRAS